MMSPRKTNQKFPQNLKSWIVGDSWCHSTGSYKICLVQIASCILHCITIWQHSDIQISSEHFNFFSSTQKVGSRSYSRLDKHRDEVKFDSPTHSRINRQGLSSQIEMALCHAHQGKPCHAWNNKSTNLIR